VPHEAVEAAIARSPILGTMTQEHQRRLASTAIVRRLQRGEHVFHRGDSGGGMYVVASGSVALMVTGISGNEVTLDVLQPCREFGEMAVLDGGARIATAVVREPTVLLELPRAAVLRALGEDPRLARGMLVSMAEIVRRLDDYASDLVLLDLRGRLAKYLVRVADAAAGSTAPSAAVPVDLQVNQTELAQMVGGSRPHVNRILGELAHEGAIVRRGARVVAVRRDLLRVWTGEA
jgi:CRP/FNR family transcriptional regulator, cyclic AMP receptor protein